MLSKSFRGSIYSLFSRTLPLKAKYSHHYYKSFSIFTQYRPTTHAPIWYSFFIPFGVNINGMLSSFISYSTANDESDSNVNDQMINTKQVENDDFIFACGTSAWPYHHQGRGLVEPSESCKAYGVGDDAFLATVSLLAVADGVGGWSSTPGADASAYSRNLLSFLSMFLQDFPSSSLPAQLLFNSVDKACTHVSHILGSSTLSFAFLLRNRVLCLFNLGDSGIILVREGKCIYRSIPQCYRHNTPYQLGPKSKTKPTDGSVQILSPQSGDIVLLATDGLFDNMNEEDIINRISNFSSFFNRENAEVSTALASLSSELLEEAKGAFSSKNSAKKPLQSTRFPTGKPDDITIIIGMVIAR